MDEQLTCPRIPERTHPPESEELLDEACLTCPALLKEVNERGEVTYYCLVYRNRFSSPGGISPISTVESKPKWNWERHWRD